jgi:hypothetical protein
MVVVIISAMGYSIGKPITKKTVFHYLINE